MGSKTKTTTQTDMGPWKVQQPYLSDAFSQAKDLYNKTSAQPGYTGDFYAPMTGTQRALQDTALGYFTKNGSDMATEISNASSGLAGVGGQGLIGSAEGLNTLANGDMTGINIANANRYADNPYLGQMVDAATYDARRNVAENVLPTMYRQNAATGNMNSDRAALAEGVVNRGLAEQAQNLSASLRGNAYQTGLGMSQADEAQRAQNYQAAAQAYDTLLARGAGGLADAFNMQSQTMGNAMNYAGLTQQEQQALLENNFQKQQYAENRPYDLLNRYYGLVGSQNWGQNGTTSSTQTTNPGAASIIGGALGAAGSLFGGMGVFGQFGAGSGLLSNAAKVTGTYGRQP